MTPRTLTIGGIGLLLLAALPGCPPDDDGVIDIDGGGDDDTNEVDDGIREEHFEQNVAEATDVLFVVDNSASMEEEQDALMTNFEYFIQYFVGSGLDYHIGITVNDDWSGQPPIGELFGPTPYIDVTTPDPVDAFTANMIMGDDGLGACEVGLEASYRALTEPLLSGYNAGFYREEALLNVVIVSDEGDGSLTNLGNCPTIGYMDYIPWFTQLKPSGIDDVFFATIVGDQPNGCSSAWGDAEPGRGYYEVYTALGDDHALNFSICEQDWSDVMTDLGVRAAGLRTAFPLHEVPLYGTIDAYLDRDGDGTAWDEEPIPHDPTYSEDLAFAFDAAGNSLVFSTASLPPPGSTLRVVYQVEM